MRAAGENFQSFFCNFVNLKSIGEKICILYTNLGGKYAFPPIFSSPFNHFFPQHDIWPGGGGVKQKNIHTCLPQEEKKLVKKSKTQISLVTLFIRENVLLKGFIRENVLQFKYNATYNLFI